MPSDFNNLGRLAQQVQRASTVARQITVDEAAEDVRAGYRDPKSGRVRLHSDGSGLYIASAPGETPAEDTGELYRETYGMEVDHETSAIVADTPYAEELENERERPILAPHVNSVKVALYQNLADELSKTG